jgi:LuxR family transcriptional regulator of csgAB operon
MLIKDEEKNPIKVYILSQLSLETDFLAYTIEKEINARCFIFDQELNIFPNKLVRKSNFNQEDLCSSLVLIDREIHRFKNITQEVSNNQHCVNSKIALYNIIENTMVDKSLMTKQIRGIFYKDDHLDTFIKGIKAIIRNEVWISRETLLQYVFDDFSTRKKTFEKSNKLTKREVEILTLVSMGASNDEIADKIFISTNTVKTHLYNIFKKIDVQNRIQAALWAAKKL